MNKSSNIDETATDVYTLLSVVKKLKLWQNKQN